MVFLGVIFKERLIQILSMQQAHPTTHEIEFDNNRLLPLLFGERDRYLNRMSEVLDVTIHARGNRVWVQGEAQAVKSAETVLHRLYERLKQGVVLNGAEVEAALRTVHFSSPALSDAPSLSHTTIATRRKVVRPRTLGQASYIEALHKYEMVFGIGPAGTGKTFLAVAMGVSYLLTGKVKRIVLSRPAVEAGERLGFLPGDMKEKVDPYLRPLYDALFEMLPDENLSKRFEGGEIEVAPLAFMRGRTLRDSFIILDEAQNTTEVQMKMFLTRMGEGSRMVITGDLSQIDLPMGTGSGLKQVESILKDIEGIHFSYFSGEDIVRHPLIARIVNAYDHKA